MADSPPRTSRLRSVTLALVALALAVALALTCAPADAATPREPVLAAQARQSAQPLGTTTEHECLTNSSALCVSQVLVTVGVSTGALAAIISIIKDAPAAIEVIKNFVDWWTNRKPGKHEKGKDTQLWSGYLEYGGDGAGTKANPGLCLAAAQTFSTDVTWEPCGANGTVWVEEPDNNGGNYMFTRYTLDNGCTLVYPGYDSSGSCMVMSSTATNDTNLFVDYPEAPGGAFYQDWNP